MTPEPPRDPRDYTLAILAGFTLLFTAGTVAAAICLPMNDKLYTLLASWLAGFAGALLLRLRH